MVTQPAARTSIDRRQLNRVLPNRATRRHLKYHPNAPLVTSGTRVKSGPLDVVAGPVIIVGEDPRKTKP
jgi:hypothetical protein